MMDIVLIKLFDFLFFVCLSRKLSIFDAGILRINAIIPPSVNGSKTVYIVFNSLNNIPRLFNPQYVNIAINTCAYPTLYVFVGKCVCINVFVCECIFSSFHLKSFLA